jgi:hypothetical protein
VRANLTTSLKELDIARAMVDTLNASLSINTTHTFRLELGFYTTAAVVGVERMLRLGWCHYRKDPFPLDR